MTSKQLQKLVLQDTALAAFVAYYILEYNSAIIRTFMDYLMRNNPEILKITTYYEYEKAFKLWKAKN